MGASPKTERIGYVLAENLLNNHRRGIFKGQVYLVNPNHDLILGEKCYPSITAIPGPVETVVVAIPAAKVPETIREAGRAGVRAAIVISSGFAEVGNRKLELELLESAREHGVRVIGPNCLGVYDAYTGLDTLFLPETKLLSNGREVIATPRPRSGSITLLTQSGAFGSAALDYMAGHGMGIRGFVSYGNRCDVAEDELLEYFAKDEKTRVIMLYVEGLAKGREFLFKAKEYVGKKPIVALKAGKTEAGTRAAASHTAALAGSDQVYDGAFKQAGIIRVRNVEELFDFSRALSQQPPGYVKNVVVLTNAGGPGILAADAAEDSGLIVKKLSEDTLGKFAEYKAKKQILGITSGSNPIDLTAEATSDMYRLALSTLLEDAEVGGAIVIMQHQAPTILDDAVLALAKTISTYKKPVTVCDMGATEMAQAMREAFEKRGVPSYSTPERAARSLWALLFYGTYLKERGLLQKPLPQMIP